MIPCSWLKACSPLSADRIRDAAGAYNLVMMKIAITLLAVGAFSLALAVGPDKAVGKPLPNLFVTGIDGKKISTSDLKGKVVILDFWATWCGPCKKAGPTMDALQKKYAGKVRVIGASYDDPLPAVKKYMAEHKYSYTFATGGKAAGDYSEWSTSPQSLSSTPKVSSATLPPDGMQSPPSHLKRR